MKHKERSWDTQYEWRAVVLLALGFGLVGFDRFMIMPMFPVMMKDLHLDYQDLGNIAGILAIAWGIASIFVGNISDRIGYRKVIIPSIIIFSLLAGVSGMATGITSLMIIRALIGFSEGAYPPASIVATLEASKPSRHGLNMGIQQTAMPLFGLTIAPILATQLLKVVNWHWIFMLVLPPGLLVAYLMHKVLREPKAVEVAEYMPLHDAKEHKWYEVFRYHNVPLNMLSMLCWLTCLIVASALFPSYLIDYLHLSVQQMGGILSALGLGGSLGSVAMPALSDRIGRKPVMILSVLGTLGALLLLINTGADPVKLFGLLFIISFFNFSLICLTVGPLCAESVPVKLMSTASGLVIGVGEVFGGGVAPAIAGGIAKHFGIQYILHLAGGAMAIGFLVTLALRETAPALLKVAEPAPDQFPPAHKPR